MIIRGISVLIFAIALVNENSGKTTQSGFLRRVFYTNKGLGHEKKILSTPLDREEKNERYNVKLKFKTFLIPSLFY